MEKIKGMGYKNEKGKFECPYCKEKFRLKQALKNHKCIMEYKNRRKN